MLCDSTAQDAELIAKKLLSFEANESSNLFVAANFFSLLWAPRKERPVAATLSGVSFGVLPFALPTLASFETPGVFSPVPRNSTHSVVVFVPNVSTFLTELLFSDEDDALAPFWGRPPDMRVVVSVVGSRGLR